MDEDSDLLDSFRKNWLQEIHQTTNPENDSTINHSTGTTTAKVVPVEKYTKEQKEEAIDLFMKASQEENQGNMSAAVTCYSKAFKIWPDVEKEIRTLKLSAAKLKKANLPKIDKSFVDSLTTKVKESGVRFTPRNGSVCLLNTVPPEMVLKIVQAVVGKENDQASLERLSMVCAAFFVFSRDNAVWKYVYNQTTNNSEEFTVKPLSWRSLFHETPHINFNGYYAGKSSYIRHGEASFQDGNYKPWFTIAYYRVLRLFPNGKCLTLLTNENPHHNQDLMNYSESKSRRTCEGTWKLENDELSIHTVAFSVDTDKIRYPKKKSKLIGNAQPHTIGKRTDDIKFRIEIDSRKKFGLDYQSHSLTVHYAIKESSVTEFETNNKDKYPFLHFFNYNSKLSVD